MICGCCGEELHGTPRDVGCQLPDVVFDLSKEELRRRVLFAGDLVVLDKQRHFLRCVLPIRLQDLPPPDNAFRYGIWVEIDEKTVDKIGPAWDDPDEYMKLWFDGKIANELWPWNERIIDASVTCGTRAVDQRPLVMAAEPTWLAAVLAVGWNASEYHALLRHFGAVDH